MNTIFFLAIWTLSGLWSFIFTQNLIKGWDYVKSQPNPWKLFVSAMFLGPITTLTCFYTIFMYFKHRGGKNGK